jgi:hypothetical protein
MQGTSTDVAEFWHSKVSVDDHRLSPTVEAQLFDQSSAEGLLNPTNGDEQNFEF